MNKLVICLTCALLLAVAPVMAAPSVNGSTGLIHNPTADVLRTGQISLGYYHLKDGSVGTVNTNLAPNLEIGVSAFRYDGRQKENNLNVKFALRPETVLIPGLAVGIEDITKNDKRSVYAVASKALPFGLRIHAGAGSGRYSGVFAGIEKTINPISVITGSDAFPSTNLIVEYDGKRMNYGARLSIVPGLKLDAGVRNHNGYIGISFTN